MDILVSGSLAYDRIMEFPGHFSDHILPDKIHMINVSFTVSHLDEKFGGTAGNIAYALAQLGESPRIIATVGQDYQRYFHWLEQNGLTAEGIRIVPEEFTSSAFITTDVANNQITGFNPGAMKFQAEADFNHVSPSNSLAIISPGNVQDMADFAALYEELGVYSIFDPGQSLPVWSGQDLARSISQSNMLVCNEYELELIQHQTALSVAELEHLVEAIIITKGSQGCELRTSEKSLRIPAVPTEDVLDPTGAGDAFRGGLIKGLVQGYTVDWAAKMGSVCAHYSIQGYGTQDYSFNMTDYLAKLTDQYKPQQQRSPGWPAVYDPPFLLPPTSLRPSV
jgi:adenosine kinase